MGAPPSCSFRLRGAEAGLNWVQRWGRTLSGAGSKWPRLPQAWLQGAPGSHATLGAWYLGVPRGIPGSRGRLSFSPAADPTDPDGLLALSQLPPQSGGGGLRGLVRQPQVGHNTSIFHSLASRLFAHPKHLLGPRAAGRDRRDAQLCSWQSGFNPAPLLQYLNGLLDKPQPPVSSSVEWG